MPYLTNLFQILLTVLVVVALALPTGLLALRALRLLTAPRWLVAFGCYPTAVMLGMLLLPLVINLVGVFTRLPLNSDARLLIWLIVNAALWALGTLTSRRDPLGDDMPPLFERRWHIGALLVISLLGAALCLPLVRNHTPFQTPTGETRWYRASITDWEKHFGVGVSLINDDHLPPKNGFMSTDEYLRYYYFTYLLPATAHQLLGGAATLANSMFSMAFLIAFCFPWCLYAYARRVGLNGAGALVATAVVTLVSGLDIIPVLYFRVESNGAIMAHADGWLSRERRLNSINNSFIWAPQHIIGIIAFLFLLWLIRRMTQGERLSLTALIQSAGLGVLVAALAGASSLVWLGAGIALGFAGVVEGLHGVLTGRQQRQTAQTQPVVLAAEQTAVAAYVGAEPAYAEAEPAYAAGLPAAATNGGEHDAAAPTSGDALFSAADPPHTQTTRAAFPHGVRNALLILGGLTLSVVIALPFLLLIRERETAPFEFQISPTRLYTDLYPDAPSILTPLLGANPLTYALEFPIQLIPDVGLVLWTGIAGWLLVRRRWGDSFDVRLWTSVIAAAVLTVLFLRPSNFINDISMRVFPLVWTLLGVLTGFWWVQRRDSRLWRWLPLRALLGVMLLLGVGTTLWEPYGAMALYNRSTGSETEDSIALYDWLNTHMGRADSYVYPAAVRGKRPLYWVEHRAVLAYPDINLTYLYTTGRALTELTRRTIYLAYESESAAYAEELFSRMAVTHVITSPEDVQLKSVSDPVFNDYFTIVFQNDTYTVYLVEPVELFMPSNAP